MHAWILAFVLLTYLTSKEWPCSPTLALAQVREMEKYYVFEGTVGSQKMGVLSEATKTLQKALSTVNEKAEVGTMQ